MAVLKMNKGVFFFAALSLGIYYGNELIIGFIDFQNAHYSTFFGGEHVIAETRDGKLRGFTSVSRDGREFYEFLGVPFAQTPTGKLRFEPPVKTEKWTGVRDALSYGQKCTQYDFIINMFLGDEDCLNLNVYTPSTKLSSSKSKVKKVGVGEEKLLPVIVFIFGGMFMFGRTEIYRPEYFMDQDVVLVSINYRLGPYGFLNTGDETVRGNMGLKDQNMAFKWIRDNIESFGGNPNLVTLMGESAGGASIHYHMLSPQSKGLFHRAISMSGTALNSWALAKKPKEQSIHFGKKLGCPTNSSAQLVSCLKGLDAKTIAYTFKEAREVTHNRLAAFAPSLEGVNDQDTFLVEHPKVGISKGQILTNVPWMLGVNDQEGLIYAGDILLNKTNAYWFAKNWFKIAPTVFHYEHVSGKRRKEISKKLWNFYLRGHEPLRLHTSLFNLTAIFSDINFYAPLKETIEIQSNRTSMYLYYYSYPARHGLAQMFMKMPGLFPVVLDGAVGQLFRLFWHNLLGFEEKRYGACHTDELGVIFQLPTLVNNISPGSVDYEMSKAFVQSISYFAVHGKPMDMSGQKWPMVELKNGGGILKDSKLKLQYMQIDKEFGLIDEPFKERLDFLSELFKGTQEDI